jgi:hypothetical protein
MTGQMVQKIGFTLPFSLEVHTQSYTSIVIYCYYFAKLMILKYPFLYMLNKKAYIQILIDGSVVGILMSIAASIYSTSLWIYEK